jgi:hypothetical protein
MFTNFSNNNGTFTSFSSSSFSSSSSLSTHEQDQALVKAFYQLEKSRKINVLASVLIITVGLIGNIIISSIFSNKKTRTNSARVYFFYLSLIDCLFLVVHLFEDTIRNYNDIYNNNEDHTASSMAATLVVKHTKSVMDTFVSIINITDKYDLTCRLINYFRYVFRFTSVYIIVAFTVQRLLMLHSPTNHSNFQSNNTAWITIWMITSLSAIMNTWVLFLFEIQTDETNRNNQRNFCDIKVSWKAEYFQISSFFIFLVILVPIIVLLTSDVIIILYLIRNKNRQLTIRLRRFSNFYKEDNMNNRIKNDNLEIHNNMMSLLNTTTATNHTNYKRKQLDLLKTSATKIDLNNNSPEKRSSVSILPVQSPRRFSFKLNSNFNKATNSTEDLDARRLTIMTVLISLSFSLLNLPYLIVWGTFYKELTFNKQLDLVTKYYFFSMVQIAEIFFLFYYSLNFFFFICFK